jgi:hypothetical protein
VIQRYRDGRRAEDRRDTVYASWRDLESAVPARVFEEALMAAGIKKPSKYREAAAESMSVLTKKNSLASPSASGGPGMIDDGWRRVWTEMTDEELEADSTRLDSGD